MSSNRYRSIAEAQEGTPRLRPILAPYEWGMTTSHVDFDTARPVYVTASKCHVSHIVCDTQSWGQKVAQALEDMNEVQTARTLWVPAVNNHGNFGRWAFVEVTDPWRAKSLLRAALGRKAAA